MPMSRAGFRVTIFQFTAHPSKIGRQDKFMPFSVLVAITILLLFIYYSLRHIRLFKLFKKKFSYCFSKLGYTGIFLWFGIFKSKKLAKPKLFHWPSSAFLRCAYQRQHTFVQCSHWKTVEDAIV